MSKLITYKFCLPIISRSQSMIEGLLQKHLEQYSYFEIWLDYLDDPDPDFIRKISAIYQDKIIYLLRRKNLEKTKLSIEKQSALLNTICDTSSIIDLDINNQSDELELIYKHNLKCRLISSYHNYDETPDDNELLNLYESMKKYTPEIYKFSCFCNKDSDSLRLLNLLLKIRQNADRYIVLGMGEKALPTRVFAAKWGNEMIFAPQDQEQASAPGQLTYHQHLKLFELI